jgi:hypothetical protein
VAADITGDGAREMVALAHKHGSDVMDIVAWFQGSGTASCPDDVINRENAQIGTGGSCAGCSGVPGGHPPLGVAVLVLSVLVHLQRVRPPERGQLRSAGCREARVTGSGESRRVACARAPRDPRGVAASSSPLSDRCPCDFRAKRPGGPHAAVHYE